MGNESSFRHYHISQGADGMPIGLSGAEGEEVFLALDGRSLRFCELHVLASERTCQREFQRAFYEVAEDYAGIRHGMFPEILESGVDDGIPFYAVAYRDGEALPDYLKRARAQPAGYALKMILGLAEALVDYRAQSEFHLTLGAESMQVFREPEGRPGLRLADFGLAAADRKRHGAWEEEFARGCVDLLELVLAGGEGEAAHGEDEDGETQRAWRIDPDRWEDAIGIREDLAEFIREARGNRHLRLREVIQKVGGFLAVAPEVRSPEKYRPEAGLADMLVGHPGWEQVLGDYRAQMDPDGASAVGRISSQGSVDRAVRIHPLPPGKALPEAVWDGLRAVRDALTKPDECPALIRIHAVRPGGAAAHLAEERVDGFSVAEMLAAHGRPPMAEAHRLLQKVRVALSQADVAKLPVFGRLADQVLLTFRGLAGKANPWAGAGVRLRTHVTLGSLLAPGEAENEAGELGAFLDVADALIRGDGEAVEGIDGAARERIDQLFAEFRGVQADGSNAGDRASRKWSRGNFLRKMEGMARASERFSGAGNGFGELASEEEFSDDPFENDEVEFGTGIELEGIEEGEAEGAAGSFEKVGAFPRSEGEGIKVAETTDRPPTKRRGGWFRWRR